MLGTLVYCLLDISFNILFWTTKKTFNGLSMLYYYLYNYENNSITYEVNLFDVKKQIINHSKMLKELKSKTIIKN